MNKVETSRLLKKKRGSFSSTVYCRNFPVDEIQENEIQVIVLGLDFTHRTGTKIRTGLFVRKNLKNHTVFLEDRSLILTTEVFILD